MTKEYRKDTVAVFHGETKDAAIHTERSEIAEAKWFKLNDLPEISEYSKLCLEMWDETA